MSRNKSDKRSIRPLCQKLQNIAEIKKCFKKWRDIPSLWIERLTIIKISISNPAGTA